MFWHMHSDPACAMITNFDYIDVHVDMLPNYSTDNRTPSIYSNKKIRPIFIGIGNQLAYACMYVIIIEISLDRNMERLWTVSEF